MTERSVEFLSVDDLVTLADVLLGAGAVVRDVGLLAAAAARPQATAFGEDAYPDVLNKAAALLQSVVNNHALDDGNKRLGWLSCAVFLDLNGIDPTRASNDDVFELVMWVAAEQGDIDEVTSRLAAIR